MDYTNFTGRSHLTPNLTSRAQPEQSGCEYESYSGARESNSKSATSQRSRKSALQCCSLRTGVTSAVEEGLGKRCAKLYIHKFPSLLLLHAPKSLLCKAPLWSWASQCLEGVQPYMGSINLNLPPSTKTALAPLSVKPSVPIEKKDGFAAYSSVLNLV